MLQCVAVCCGVLQCVAVCCTYGSAGIFDDVSFNVYNVLQRVAVHCSMMQCVAVRCSVLQYVAVCCSMLQYVVPVAVRGSSMTSPCDMLQCVAV